MPSAKRTEHCSQMLPHEDSACIRFCEWFIDRRSEHSDGIHMHSDLRHPSNSLHFASALVTQPYAYPSIFSWNEMRLSTMSIDLYLRRTLQLPLTQIMGSHQFYWCCQWYGVGIERPPLLLGQYLPLLVPIRRLPPESTRKLISVNSANWKTLWIGFDKIPCYFHSTNYLDTFHFGIYTGPAYWQKVTTISEFNEQYVFRILEDSKQNVIQFIVPAIEML